jgi:hypothetical protein
VSTTVLNNFTHDVRDEMIDLDSRSFYLSMLWQDLTEMMRGSESMDIGEFSNITIQDAVDTSVAARSHNNLTVQDIDDIATTLRKDQARGFSGELRRWKKHFQGAGRGQYVQRVAKKVQASLRNDQDSRDANYLAFVGAQIVGAADAAAVVTHENVNGAALTLNMVRSAIARMTDVDGVDKNDLVWMLDSWGAGTIKTLPEFEKMDKPMAELGLRMVGSIDGIPAFESQSVPSNRSLACTASSVATNILTLTFAEAHGFVVGQNIVAPGLTAPLASSPVLTVPSTTTLTVALTTGDTADNGTGTVSEANPTSWNILANRDRLWRADEEGMLRVIPYGRERTSDVMQAELDYGRRTREGQVSSVIVVHTDHGSILAA